MSDPIIHDPGNETEIDTLYAFMSIDEKGRHGIVAEMIPGLGTTTLIFGSRKNAHKMMPFAQKVAERTGKPVGLFAFKRSHQLWQSD
jgi:hypothetical protein